MCPFKCSFKRLWAVQIRFDDCACKFAMLVWIAAQRAHFKRLSAAPITAISFHCWITCLCCPPLSIFFSFHPFANVWSAVLKLYAIRFATNEETQYIAIDDANVFQIENDVAQVGLVFKKSPQLRDRRCFDPAAKGEYRESPARRGLNPKRHRLAKHRSEGRN
jgi:hypothetical protein